MPSWPLTARVVAIREEAESIFSFEIVDARGHDLPLWEPGAHVDIELPNGIIRQYSLCGEVGDFSRYRLGVLKVPGSRGGSEGMHDLKVGTEVTLHALRNQFPLRQSDEYLFLAGGIGITPILPMFAQASAQGAPSTLVYAVRNLRRAAFRNELNELADSGRDFQLHLEDQGGTLDLADLVGRHPNAAIYACGPAGMLDAITHCMEQAGRSSALYLERFVPTKPTPVNGGDAEAVDIYCRKSDITFQLPSELTVLEAIRDAGIDVESSCEQGICGTCEVRVVEGEIDHQDLLLTEQEQAAGAMLVCVSRPKRGRVVIDV